MINVFNRKEICVTYDMAEQARVREILANNHIDYEVFTKDLAHSSQLGATAGTVSIGGMLKVDSIAGVDLHRCIEYRIYVKKSDYEEALYLLNK